MKFYSVALLAAFSVPAIHAADFLVLEHPRTPKRIWIRRATLAAGCAASLALDTLSTRRAVGRGAVESNGLFANAQGQPQWARMIGIKAALCGSTAWLEESHVFKSWETPAADWTWAGINSGITGLYTRAAWHNLGVAEKK